MAALDFALTDDQQMLQDSVQRFLSDRARPSWHDLSESLGLAGIALPAAAGGFGGGAVDIAIVMAELGPALAGADWLSHAAATILLARLVPGHPALPDLAAGVRRAAILCAASTAAMPTVEGGGAVRGTATLVAGGAEADLFLLADGDALLLIAADGDTVERRHRIMHDGSVCADLSFVLKADVLATSAQARDLAGFANDLILAARCAEAVGLMQHMIAASVAYLGQRQQFGVAIGTFQALRHRAADMQLAAMTAAALTEAAILAVDRDSPDRAAAVGAACTEVIDAVRKIGENAIQIHGAMGLTGELALGGHFKRALAIAAAMGPRAEHIARFAEAAS